MANRFKLRRGSNTPSLNDLEDFELGYSINENQLYLKVSEEKDGVTTKRIVKVPERNVEFIYNLKVSNINRSITITEDLLKNKVAAIIDLNYASITNDNIITTFRNLDLVEDSQADLADNQIKLKVRGKLPTTEITIPIKVLVIK